MALEVYGAQPATSAACSLSSSVSSSPSMYQRRAAWTVDKAIRTRVSLSIDERALLVPRNVRFIALVPSVRRTSGRVLKRCRCPCFRA